MWTIFSLYGICCNIASTLCFGFLVTRHLISGLGIETATPAVEGGVLTPGPPTLEKMFFLIFPP